PTAGVDIEIRRSMWEFMNNINAAGTTIILTTHYLEEAESLCKNIAIIDHGKIAKNTSMQALLKQLQIETFVLNLREAIHSVPDIAHDYTLRLIDEHTLEVDITKDRSINELFAALSEKGLHVLSMRNKANRLEELFMRLVENNDNGGAQA
ncbi:MAG: ABC transporter ATP-binding protein, partial [Gammaproteobacteria bacterium]|nr:ABC transporter ATP-binding protein [Gammaproteobacteria bacterium]